MDIKLEDSWREALKEEFGKPYFVDLIDFVKREYRTTRVFPAARNIFRALDECSLGAVRVVIIGQDPYHGAGQANGLCFAVDKGVEAPPSLRNILKEAGPGADINGWARQGVLMLNSVLTVRAGEAASHSGMGWERFTDAVVRVLNGQREGLVYMLWGSYAQRKASMVDEQRNLVLKAVHPSPLSAYRGFMGCDHFSKANEYLKEKIKW